MRLSTVIIFLTIVQVSASTYGQKVTYLKKEITLVKLFKEIKRQTGYNVVWYEENLDATRLVGAKFKDAPIEDVMNKALTGLHLSYTISKNTVVIKEKERSLFDKISDAIHSLVKDIHVRGSVTDEYNKPISGATVKIKGTTRSVITDTDGKFYFENVKEKAVLVISYLGYKTMEIEASEQLPGIRLVESMSELAEVQVVNTGYQKLPKERATGSFALVNNELIERSVSTGILDRLSGVTSGLLVSNQAGNSLGVNIRGLSSIFANTNPLVVLDNFPYDGDINNINPNDIESVTILKDAAASSIWGVLAGNGVIVLTSKKGAYNRPIKVSFNSNVQIRSKPNFDYAPIMSSSDYIDVETYLYGKGFYTDILESSTRTALSPVVETLVDRDAGTISSADAKKKIDDLRKQDVRKDYSKYYYRTMVNQQYALNLSGGGDNNQYYISAGYDKNLSSLVGNENDRISLNANNTYSLLNHKIEISTGLFFVQTNALNNSVLPVFGGGALYPYAKLADANGNALAIDRYRRGYIDSVGHGKLLDWSYRPVDELSFANNKNSGTNYRATLNIRYKVIKNLALELQYMFERGQTDIKKINSLQTFYTRDYINQFSSINDAIGQVLRPVPLGDIFDKSSSTYSSKNVRGQVNYDNQWGDKHQLTMILGVENKEINTNGNFYRTYGYGDDGSSFSVDFANPYVNYVTGNSGVIYRGAGFTGTNYRYLSGFTNAAYTYLGKYSLSASVRKDATNLVGVNTNQKWVPLWSAGAAWNIAKEPFYQLNFLPDLKLRITYGYQGNIDQSVSGLLTINGSGENNRWGTPSNVIVNPPNPNLKWEKTSTLNFGLDYGSEHNKISGSFEYYRKRGVDLLGYATLAPSTGVSLLGAGFKGNTADMKGEGIDLVINTINTAVDIKWSTNFLFSYAKDWITVYKQKLNSIQSYIVGSGLINPIAGRPVTALYSYKWAGLDPLTGDPQGYVNNKVSKDYSLLTSSSDLNDMVYNGPSLPPIFGSVRNNLSWRQFSFSFNITFKLGYFFRRPSINYSNLFNRLDDGNKDYGKRWQKQGDELVTNVPSMVYPINPNRDLFYNYSEILVDKGDHIRLQDIQISYDLNRPSFKNNIFKNVRLYLYVSNLGILWKANKDGIDPDNIPNNFYNYGSTVKSIALGAKLDF